MPQTFRTTATPLDCQGLITHSTPLLILGSCFADNIGARLRDSLFDICVNPFGTLYNPASIAACARRLADPATGFTAADIVQRDGLWHSWGAHSSLSRTGTQQAFLSHLEATRARAAAFARTAAVAIITLGTTHIYTRPGYGTVANCHKFPATEFQERDLGLDECVSHLTDTIAALRSLSPEIHIILTVSPVRYLSQGLAANSLSKATLRLAADAAARQCPDVTYFPAFEILNDDLRDYRFYAADMKHPSDTAVDYIADIFASSFFNPDTRSLADTCAKFTRRLAHRTLSPDSPAAEAFAQATAAFAAQLTAAHPCLAPRIQALSEKL